MLALNLLKSKRIAATALPRNEVADIGVKFFVRFIDKTGVQRFINFRNNEPAILALKGAATKPLAFLVLIPESCPVVDRGAEGSIEMSVRQLKRQMRAVQLTLEKTIGMTLATWIPTFSGNVIARFR